MEFDFLNVFLVLYAAHFAAELTFFGISFMMQYYRIRKQKKNMDLLRQNLAEQLNSIKPKSGNGDNNDK